MCFHGDWKQLTQVRQVKRDVDNAHQKPTHHSLILKTSEYKMVTFVCRELLHKEVVRVKYENSFMTRSKNEIGPSKLSQRLLARLLGTWE